MESYHILLKTILEKGTHKPAARENMPGTQSLFGYQFRHNLQKGFPLLTTKKMFWKGVVVELLWFLRGDTNIKYLVDHGVNIWNEDAYNYFKKKFPEVAPHKTMEQFLSDVKDGVTLGSTYTFGDCGYQYGKVWRKWEGKIEKIREDYHRIFVDRETIDQIQRVIDSLKKDPSGRRHMVTAVDPAHDNELALYWCHALFQFNCREMTEGQRMGYVIDNFLGEENAYAIQKPVDWSRVEEQFGKVPTHYLDCQLYQRSADVFLGVPFNIASYALLTHIVARMCNMVPGEFIHTFGDVHIYDNHRDAVTEQLSREPMELPRLELANNANWAGTIDRLLESVVPADFSIVGYQSHPAIKAELSTGMKK